MEEPQTIPLRLSWSAIQAYLSCARKYDLRYRAMIRRKPSTEMRALLLGSAVHAGIEAALLVQFDAQVHELTMTTDWLVKAAVEAAHQYITDNTVQGKMTRDYNNGGALVVDLDYYAMLREVTLTSSGLLRYHIPLMGLGSRFIVPTVQDVLSGEEPALRRVKEQDPVPAVEWHFELPLDADTLLTGYIDTILWDTENLEYLMVDWKTRSMFPHDSMALIDGQLHLYAGVVNAMAEQLGNPNPINAVVMWQLSTKEPAPASISKRDGLPNTGATSYATTWEVWVKTLPHGIDPDKYAEVMRPKLKVDADFQRPVVGFVTVASSQVMLDNVYAAADSIRAAIATGKPMAAILSSNGCKFCDYGVLCANAFRYGGDVDPILNEHFEFGQPVDDNLGEPE